MFGRQKRDRGPVIEATAIVTNIQDTGMTINDNPRVKLTLNVKPEGQAPFEVAKKVTVSRINLPRVGDPIRVQYYANDPEGLKVQKRTPEDLAAAAAAPQTAPVASDPLEQIKKLNDLRLSGALTDAEFQVQKAKILN